MATSEITRPERSLIAISSQLADLTERDRIVDARSEAYRAVPIEKTITVIARGKPVQFKYQDRGDRLPDWFVPVLEGFANLLTLPDNWDGEGASPIDRDAISRALAAIEQLLTRRAPAPSVVPTPDSGLQIEWHLRAKDLEIEFHPDGRTEFYYFDESGGEEYEGPIGQNSVILKKYLKQIW